MPDRYHIKTTPTPGRFRRVGKHGTVDMREDCSRCSNCVKPRCPYDAHREEIAHNRDPHSSVQPLYECRACLSCVQGCTKGLLSLCVNPEYLELGDDYWQPDVLDATWKQADSGRVPVSGAGYRGRFAGAGFDSMWMDMSEITRPARDGTCGREYINTSVDIGPKPMRLFFGPNGELQTAPASIFEIRIPAIFDVPPWRNNDRSLTRARLRASAELRTLAVVRASEFPDLPREYSSYAVPLIENADLAPVETALTQVRMVLIEDGTHTLAVREQLTQRFPKLVLGVRMPLHGACQARVLDFAQMGIKVFHLCADLHGCEQGVHAPRHIKDAMRELHAGLVKAGVRDEITLIVGGGIALPEHMTKSIICGADLVALDAAVIVALGCRVCSGSERSAHEKCPAELEHVDESYAAQRIVNLLGAWHSQLVEALGAMGIREVRRLRGEVGRAIFMEDIEREAFGDLVRKQH